jgi:hypothetical protein
MAVDTFSVVTRVGSIVVALFIISSSIATLRVISDNDKLVHYRDLQDNGELDELSQNERALRGLIIFTQAAAVWGIILCTFTTIAGVLSVIIVVINRQPIGKIILGVIEIVFIVIGTLLYLSLGIACAVHAADWGEPPETCTERFRDLSDTSNNSDDFDDICNSVALNTTNSLQAVFSFVEIGVFGAVILATIFSLRSKPTTTNTISAQEKS